MVDQTVMPLDVPAKSAITMITLGGSHRSIRKAISAFEQAGIRNMWLGPVNINSKRHKYAIPTVDLDRALSLNVGASHSREQWAWLAETDLDTFFGAAPPQTAKKGSSHHGRYAVQPRPSPPPDDNGW